MQQLKLPIFALEVAKGMGSEVVQLLEPASGRIVYTGWLRRLKSSGHVIYAGFYSTVQVPGEPDPCVKVTFPCDGSANVYLSPVAHPDGSFGLGSSRSPWGRSGPVTSAGFSPPVQVPGEPDPCVKVPFPCDGSATVSLPPVAHPAGSFGLDSSGPAWGRSGFYRIQAEREESRPNEPSG